MGITAAWDWLEQWCAVTFLITGGIWLLSAAFAGLHTRFNEFMGIHLGDPAQILVILGIIAPFVCLVGLYPGLVDRTPRLAVAGLAFSGFSALTQLFFLLLAAMVVTQPGITDLSGFTAVGRGLVVIWAVGFVIYPVGTTLFATGILRADDRSKSVGYLLLGPLALWVLSAVRQFVVGYNGFGPLGSDGVVPALMGVVYVAIGYLLTIETAGNR